METKLRLSLILVVAIAVSNVSGYGPPPARSPQAEPTNAKVKEEPQPSNPTWAAGQNARGYNRPSEGGAQDQPNPSSVLPNPECMLRLKSDCHAGVPSSGQRAIGSAGNPPNYQLDGFAAYPVYTAYVIPAVGSFGSPPLQRPLDPSQQNTIVYSSVPDSEQGPVNFEPNQPPPPTFQGNYEPQAPQSQSPPKGQLSYNNYKPAVVPYKAPTSPAYSNAPQGESGRLPATGTPSEQPASGGAIPYPGCPAAMVCVQEEFCDAKGVRAANPVQLSAAEKLYRVALEICSAPTTGEVGVCCRDPDYKDPWPMMNGGQDDGDRQGKGIQYDDGQYRPETYANAQRQGKNVQYDDGQYRPDVHGQPQDKGVVAPGDGQYHPQPQTPNNPPQVHRQRPPQVRPEQPTQYQQPQPQFGDKLTPQAQSQQKPSQYQQQAPQYQPQAPQFQQQVPQYQPQAPQYQQPSPQYQQPSPQYQQPSPQYQQPSQQYQRASPQYQQTPPQQNQPLPPATSGKADPGSGPGGCRSGY